MQEKILVLDFGGQYNLLIARRIRQQHVYAEVKSYNSITTEQVQKEGYQGIVFTGGPNSVYDSSSPHFDPEILALKIPILGICYGHQLLAWMAGGEIQAYGPKEEVLPGLLKGTMTNPALEQDESLECPTLLGKMK